MMAALADAAWVAAPLAVLLAACLALVPLGTQVLARGVVFIDLAVAQVAACGALASAILIDHPAAWVASGFSATAALAGAALVWWLARAWAPQREALIGLAYVAAASLALVAAAWEPHGRDRLTALLAADVLWASWAQAMPLAAMALAVLAARRWLVRDAAFYPLFALTLSAAVPALGLYLVFALLIGPALWVRRGLPLPPAIALAMLACGGGLGLSWWLDWPSGACVALGLSALGLAASLRPGGAGGPTA